MAVPVCQSLTYPSSLALLQESSPLRCLKDAQRPASSRPLWCPSHSNNFSHIGLLSLLSSKADVNALHLLKGTFLHGNLHALRQVSTKPSALLLIPLCGLGSGSLAEI